MDCKEFVNLVSEMMDAQAAYFKDRTQSNMIKSKDLEKRIRKALTDGISHPVEATLVADPDGEQISLFGE